MKTGEPEKFKFSAANPKNEGILKAGYTVNRIKKLSPVEITDIRTVEPKYTESLNTGSEIAEEKSREEKELEIRLEVAKLASFFISQIWKKITQFLKDPRSDTDASKFVLKKSYNPETVAQTIDTYVRGVTGAFIENWYEEQEKKSIQPEPTESEEKRNWKIYARYKKMLSMGINNVVTTENNTPIISANKHIEGGIATANYISLRFLAVLPKVYEQQYKHSPTREDLLKLSKGVKPLILAMSAVDVSTLSSIHNELSLVKRFIQVPGFFNGFNPNKFWISEQGGNLYLELKPEVLDEIEKNVNATEHGFIRTGCPALISEGAEGGKVISEMYDWLEKLYKKYYIDVPNNFK